MPIYIYKAVDQQGKMIKGEMEAASEIQLTTQLAKTGYLPVNIAFKASSGEKQVAFLDRIFKRKKKASYESLVVFTRQFATIVKAAIPIIEGLSVLAEQSEDPALKEALKEAVKDVEGGTSLSGALSKHPGVFSDLYVNTVVAGESGGVLDKVLMRLSKVLESDLETRTNISSALRYPIITIIALGLAVAILSVFVVPQFSKIYTQAKMSLPLPTQIMIFISGMFRFYWYIAVPALLSVYFIFMKFINTKTGRFWWDGLKFRIPIINNVYTKITMLRFSSMLSVLYQAGLPVLKTMDIVAITIGNAVLSKEIGKIKADVADGKGISGAVLNSKFFPRLVGYMSSVGEKSGSLPMMLDSVCEYFDLEVRNTVKNLTTMIEPIMTAVLGIVVMGMALAIFLPMWNMLQVFKQG
ncbi:MAG: type II secretion system F family protein [Candidatus Omnitrophica bacterium]|nr:type II secretion system F family protein [Candidatus Omnitrophota bacterium]